MNKSLKVGLTGGIGSGKTTVARIFEVLGVPVYIADTEAKRLMHENQELRHKIVEIFGEMVYDDEGNLRRKWLADKVFKNKSLLRKLNAVVHPAVHKDAQEWFSTQNTPYAIEEAAILIESGGYRQVDVIIVVEAPEDIVIQRVMKRDDTSEKDIRARINNQMASDKRREYADYLIINDGKLTLIPQIITIHKALTKRWESNS